MGERSKELRLEVALEQLKKYFEEKSFTAKGLHFAMDMLSQSPLPSHIRLFQNALNTGVLDHIGFGRRIGQLVDALSRSGTEHGLEALRIVFADHNLFPKVVSTIRKSVFFNLISSNSDGAPHTINVGCKNGLLDTLEADVLQEALEKLLAKNHPETDEAFCSTIRRGATEFLSDEQIKDLKKAIKKLEPERKTKLLGAFVDSKSANGKHTSETLQANRATPTGPKRAPVLSD
ncbi:MAG: hypothetical protein U0R17_07115 [Acidimicrobiia bacterium]